MREVSRFPSTTGYPQHLAPLGQAGLVVDDVRVGFRTVKAAMESVWPEPRKQLPPRKTRLDAFKPVIDQMLRADLDAPRKQRHTVKRIFDRLPFGGNLIQTGTESYRLAITQARAAAQEASSG
jgi:hypothetical protein